MCPLPSNDASTANSKSIGKQEQQEKKNTKEAKEKPNNKEVIITVYVESPSLSIKINQRNSNIIKKIKPRPLVKKCHTSKSQAYDRRGQLLAYSQELRNSGSQQDQWPNNSSKPKPKKDGKVLTTPVKLREMRSRARYQKIVPEVDLPCSAKCMNGRMRKSSKTNDSHFFKKLKNMLKGMCKE